MLWSWCRSCPWLTVDDSNQKGHNYPVWWCIMLKGNVSYIILYIFIHSNKIIICLYPRTINLLFSLQNLGKCQLQSFKTIYWKDGNEPGFIDSYSNNHKCKYMRGRPFNIWGLGLGFYVWVIYFFLLRDKLNNLFAVQAIISFVSLKIKII